MFELLVMVMSLIFMYEMLKGMREDKERRKSYIIAVPPLPTCTLEGEDVPIGRTVLILIKNR